MRFIGTLMLLAGYTLVYAAVANSGEFAENPLDGLILDAYNLPDTGSGAPSPASSGTSSTPGAGTTKKGGDPGGFEGFLQGYSIVGVHSPIIKAIGNFFGGLFK